MMHCVLAAAVSGSIELEVGVNEFPFYCQRPDRKFAADAMITNEPFLVLRRYDLSLEPNTLQVTIQPLVILRGKFYK